MRRGLGRAAGRRGRAVGDVGQRGRPSAISADRAGATAVFALALRIGAIGPGVLDLYANRPGDLDAGEPADAPAFADAATLVLLDTRIDEIEGG